MNFKHTISLKHLMVVVQARCLPHTLALTLVLTVLNFGCKKGSSDDDYYVKYEVGSSTIYHGGKLNVTLNNEKNTNSTFKINTRNPWETIVGPVKRGFNAKLEVSKEGTTDSRLKLFLQISVSKNSEPFVLKKMDDGATPRNSAEITHTID